MRPTVGRLLGLVGGVFALGLMVGIPSAVAGAGPSIAGCSPGLTISAHPTAGSAPLVVAYDLTVLGAAPTSISWAFGDGSFFNGTGSAFFAPIHRFDHPGTYSTTVTVVQPGQSGSCTETLAVSSGPLQTLATVLPKAGSAPLTVEFSATVLGGSGTFRAATWSFGNGQVGSGFNLSYTYPAPGQYLAEFQVTDSSNASSNSTLFVNVTAPATVRGAGLGWTDWIGAIAVIGGVAVLGAALYARSIYADRAGRGERTPGQGVTVPPTVLLEPRVERVGPSLTPAYLPPETAIGPGPFPPSSRTPAIPARPAPDIEPALPPISVPAPSPAPAESVERFRLSQRVVLHIYTLGTLRDDEIAPPTFTQAGMSAKLSVGQSPLSNVLRRLVIAGVLSQDVRHVRGRPRRLRVYRLTPMGESLALELRRQRESGRPPIGRGPAS